MNEDLMSAVQGMQQKSDISEAIKELFQEDKEKKIFQITDLSEKQIEIATKMLSVAELRDIPEWRNVVNNFCYLQLSKNRKSRFEVLSAISGMVSGGWWQRSSMNPSNWGGNRGDKF